MTVEAFFGLAMVAVTTGLIFARFSRATARVVFSKVAVVTKFEGVPTLMFRAANQRGNQILEAEATVSLFGEVTTLEGYKMRRFQALQLVRARQPMFALSWTLMHLIDETSPLFGATLESMQADSAEIVVAVSGVDEIFAQRIYARHSYLPDEIIWNRRLADVLTTNEDGEVEAELTIVPLDRGMERKDLGPHAQGVYWYKPDHITTHLYTLRPDAGTEDADS